MAKLFTPYTLKDVTLRNRIAVPPMCQYSAIDGIITDWHVPHYAGMARGGAGLVIVEATAVSPEGRITWGDTGLWNDEQVDGMAQIARAIKSAGAVPGIQIGHAGRKASANKPWEGDDHIADDAPHGWPTLSPSAVPFGGNLGKMPKEMTIADIERVRQDFVNAAARARDAGFEWLELHFAHGYLGQSFFSIHANTRTDQYGGDAIGRGHFLVETLRAVREVWPERLPLTARFGVIEFDGRDEETLVEAIDLANIFRQAGLDFMSVGIGFSTPDNNVPWGPAFMAPIAERVRREAGLPVGTAYGMDIPADAEKAIATGELDIAMMARAHLANPHYPFRVAREMKLPKSSGVLPEQYDSWLARYPYPGPDDVNAS
ncbi:2,4-dienoyl-CoA reductase-like NADH-dependent reductase (Old Yellow Enzyme family) [Sphingobium sp. B11D3B]|uniref:NADH:flavin oxidoreductase/NADH oxidase n=1 Tax=Sphingobium sp. B11D3B TaxID=2940575 RepID=UPI002225C385|nr:NADH:flavin oxidoreductase/NADH oxidase [Sphingobium sp. B11D3B]MCW2389608.1 2,4-dienoyl-CoA reductase-like NADH-dependent reductase (Old Yellow Enzyme family) [Sphingobium sp. B11D3B]